MSQATTHLHKGFNVRLDELEPFGSLTMSSTTLAALQQLETGAEEIPAQRYVVKSKAKFTDGEHTVDSHYATKHEAVKRARTLKDAGYDTEVVDPVEADGPPLSYGRYRVHSQVTPYAPFAQESHFDEVGDAQGRAAELRDKGLNSQIIDSSSNTVVPTAYPDGTAVAPEADMRTDDEKAADAQAFPPHPVVENAPPETPEHEWIRKEKEAKEHPAPAV